MYRKGQQSIRLAIQKSSSNDQIRLEDTVVKKMVM